MFAALLNLRSDGEGNFTAPASPDKGDRIYGGQFLAQCLAAACATIADDHQVNSLHGYFMRPGNVDHDLDLSVHVLRDGRCFSSRQVVAEQAGRELFRMLVSSQVPEDSPEYTAGSVPQVHPPEDVTYTYDDFTRAQTHEAAWHGTERPMDIRYINPPRTRGESVTEAQLMWMRIPQQLPNAPLMHQAGLAYLSDSALVDHIMLPFGLRWQDADFLGTSLDHAMWFHRPARADEWLLFEQMVEATGGGRGLARGRMFNQRGELIATCMQEGLMRWVGTGRAQPAVRGASNPPRSIHNV